MDKSKAGCLPSWTMAKCPIFGQCLMAGPFFLKIFWPLVYELEMLHHLCNGGDILGIISNTAS